MNQFQKRGYILLKNFFTEDEAVFICNSANEIDSWDEEANKWMIYFEETDERKQKARIENFLRYHDGIRRLYEDRIFPVLKDMTGLDLVLLKEKLNFKKSGGKGFKAHQDHPAWTDFKSDIFVTVAFFANKTTVENGCLEFAVSDRHSTLLPSNRENLGELDYETETKLYWEPMETTPRDLVLFDSYVPHRSGDNKSEGERRVFYFTHNQEKYGNYYEQYLFNKRKYFPPDIERTSGVSVKNNRYNLANPIV